MHVCVCVFVCKQLAITLLDGAQIRPGFPVRITKVSYLIKFVFEYFQKAEFKMKGSAFIAAKKRTFIMF